jgi:hypothetical protein
MCGMRLIVFEAEILEAERENVPDLRLRIMDGSG